MIRPLPPVAALILGCASLAGAQTRAGGEFRANTYTSGEQFLPAAAADGAGGFVLAWGSIPGQDGDEAGAFAQRYSPAGAARGAEFQVNTYTTGSQTFIDLEHALIFPASVAKDAKGSFVVAWTSGPEQDSSQPGIFAQRYDPSGARRGGEFAVNAYTTDVQQQNQVAMAPDGRFVIVWASLTQDGDGFGVFGQRYAAGGDPSGAEFQVGAFTSGAQADPDVTIAPGGGFVVVWQGEGQDGSGYGIFGRRFDAAGIPRGPEFRVNTYTTGDQLHPTAATDASGNLVVVWHSLGQDGDPGDVYAQRYAATGVAQGGEFRVNAFTSGEQAHASVARDGPGNFVVTWFGAGLEDTFGVFGRRFTMAAMPRGADFPVNTETHGDQGLGEVASDDVGNFLVTWMDLQDDHHRGDPGGHGEVFGQRFGGLRPVALRLFGGNGVLEPDETVSLHPSWQNVNGAAQTFSGRLRNLTGPPGAAYTISIDNAAYGTVADGASRECFPCYLVAVQSQGPRPARHWDATADELITPDELGQEKRWTLHVGASFDDVPPASPFYGFVETLLHHGITGGCAAAAFCPQAAAARGPMAVFVLAAKEGAGYQPPACGTPVFGDVPPAHPFCRWIEELARRGVAGGCGGGNFCPEGAVTREQMAVFLLRTLDPALAPPACTVPVFADVPASSPFCRWIEELARRGVTGGCGGGNYCPGQPVTREQASAFIGATFSLALYGP
jgi:hypothetical protein